VRTNLSNLLSIAAKTPDVVHASSWRAQRHATRPQIITVWHYATAMFQVDMVQRHVIPLNQGWGSVSDKQGTRKILEGAGIITSYNNLFGK
jgi:hypothetical protein